VLKTMQAITRFAWLYQWHKTKWYETLEMRSSFYRNGHASLHVVFNNKFYGVNLPILHKTYLKMAFLVDHLIINKSLSTLHNKNFKQCFVCCSYLTASR